ncbi:hypothetical protein OKW18_001880 [Streptomyces pratensis]|nr:hypothetical protein [Streptomyces pratensis]
MRNRTADLLLTMETLYRLSYWGLLPCGNEIKHTPKEGVLKTNVTRCLSPVPSGLLQVSSKLLECHSPAHTKSAEVPAAGSSGQ